MALAVLVLLAAPSRADDRPEELQQKCDGGSGEACYQLALRYRDGQGVAKDAERAAGLLLAACKGHFGQACFTACLSGLSVLEACSRLGDSGPEPWVSVRRFVQAADNEERRRMLATSRDLSFLRWIAHSHPYVEVRSLPDWDSLVRAAHVRLTEIAQTDPDPGRRDSAIGDAYTGIPLDVLRQIATKDPDPNVRKAAKERLAGEMSPAWNQQDAAEVARLARSRDRETRAAAVGKLADVALLSEIAQNDPDAGIRENAVDRLADHADEAQVVLARIAEKDASERVRAAAAALVTDVKALERLLRSRQASVRRHALESLEGKGGDPSVILWVAEYDSDDELRQEAVRQLTDQAVLARLAKSSPNAAVRTVAVAKLQDPKLVGDVAANDPNEGVYSAAIVVLKDESVLIDVMRRRPQEPVLELLARKLTDQAALIEILHTSKESITRGIAAGRLTDTALLRQLVNDPDPVVRNEATKRLKALSSR
jgi:TPR repeat protein